MVRHKEFSVPLVTGCCCCVFGCGRKRRRAATLGGFWGQAYRGGVTTLTHTEARSWRVFGPINGSELAGEEPGNCTSIDAAWTRAITEMFLICFLVGEHRDSLLAGVLEKVTVRSDYASDFKRGKLPLSCLF